MRNPEREHRQNKESYPNQAQSGALKLTQKIWQLSWNSYFPMALAELENETRVLTFEQFDDFAQKNFLNIYHDDGHQSPFLWSRWSEAKKRYYEACGDFFGFFAASGRLVGVFLGTPLDWTSYYLRNCSILPEFQGLGLYQNFLRRLLRILASHGISRVEGHVAPSHLGHIHILNKLGFNIVGNELSERWGAQLQFVKYLNDDHQGVFHRQFCHGVHRQGGTEVGFDDNLEGR